MSETNDSDLQTRRNGNPPGEQPEFNLIRHFSLGCVGVFVAVTIVMCTGFYHVSKRYIRIDAEQHAIPIAERLAPFAFGEGASVPPPGTPAYAAMDTRMRDVLRPLLIFKIKIYNGDGRIVYSTDRGIRVGRLDPENEKLARSLAGEVVSDLQSGKTVWDLDEEEKSDGVVVETYVPVTDTKPSGGIVGVVEIYQNVSATYARLPGVIGLIVVASVVAMTSLYTILFLIVGKAHRIIGEQTGTIRSAKADVERYALELEQRVEDRTRQLRESLVQQQHDEKMVAMGTLAAGVAHELNTPLGSILGSTQMALEFCTSQLDKLKQAHPCGDAPAECSQCLDDLGRIESQAKRCRRIIRNLVDFSRKSDDDRAWEDLAELTNGCLSLIAPEANKRDIKLTSSIAETLPRMLVNGNEIQSVLVNVMGNAVAAMPDGGTIDVDLRQADGSVVIKIRDTGTGIEEANLSRIFEPFFTTKEVGKGTGLGLSISYRIVQDHGGSIKVFSRMGEGTTFVIELPLEAPDTEIDGGVEQG